MRSSLQRRHIAWPEALRRTGFPAVVQPSRPPSRFPAESRNLSGAGAGLAAPLETAVE